MFAEQIKKYRKKLKFSQKELAEKLFVTPQTISKWEKGASEPSIEHLCELSKIFSVTVDELLGNAFKQDNKDAMIAIDSGGTKTDCVLFYQDGRIIERVILGGGSPTVYGCEKAVSVFSSGIDFLLADKNINIKGIYIGTAGGMSGSNNKIMTNRLKALYPETSIKILSDIENVIGCADNIQNCVFAICGTGSVFYVKEGNERHRIGGWGYVLDEFGSGFSLGRDALRAALAEEDGIGPKTAICEMVEEVLEAGVFDKIDVVYSKGVDFIASFSKIIFKAYEMGDSVAKDILEKNISYIANMINIAEEKYNIDSNVMLSGGIVSHNKDVFLKLLKPKINKKMNIFVPDLPQIYGAAVNCCNLFSEKDTLFKANFIEGIMKNKG